jgi:2'-5' RNA ligase
MIDMPRYAIYFAPATDSAWWDAGCRWLGRDPIGGSEIQQPHIPRVSKSMFAKLTSDARRYGWHATLKAPFRLHEGFSESHLDEMAEAFAAVQRPIALDDMQVRQLRDFLVLAPTRVSAEVGALALRCVTYFDILRAAPPAAELSKRRDAGLSEKQEALLQRWGYPYTEEEFRFHMGLTDSLSGVDGDTVHALQRAAEQRFASARPALRS